ncbi:MAG: hypothetical protein F9K46_00190 [Anaerolineae bacterium]|nr:MAG: hypothetical protein F9K46_00190 [Anaerolineae bacterium]
MIDDPNPLRDMLIEDTDSDDMADALIRPIQALKQWPNPTTSTTEVQKLLDQLSVEGLAIGRNQRLNLRWMWLILRGQVRIIRKELWVASALVILIGTFVTLVSYRPDTDTFAPLVILAPIMAAVGVGLLYDAEYEIQLEIEDATPTGILRILLARLMLIFGFNLILTLGGSVILAIARAEISLGPLILAWLLPMTFLSSVAFLMSVVLRSTAFSVVVSLLLWSLHVFLTQAPPSQTLVYALSLPGLRDESTRPFLLIAAVLALLTTFLFLEKSDRELRTTA